MAGSRHHQGPRVDLGLDGAPVSTPRYTNAPPSGSREIAPSLNEQPEGVLRPDAETRRSPSCGHPGSARGHEVDGGSSSRCRSGRPARSESPRAPLVLKRGHLLDGEEPSARVVERAAVFGEPPDDGPPRDGEPDDELVEGEHTWGTEGGEEVGSGRGSRSLGRPGDAAEPPRNGYWLCQNQALDRHQGNWAGQKTSGLREVGLLGAGGFSPNPVLGSTGPRIGPHPQNTAIGKRGERRLPESGLRVLSSRVEGVEPTNNKNEKGPSAEGPFSPLLLGGLTPSTLTKHS